MLTSPQITTTVPHTQKRLFAGAGAVNDRCPSQHPGGRKVLCELPAGLGGGGCLAVFPRVPGGSCRINRCPSPPPAGRSDAPPRSLPWTLGAFSPHISAAKARLRRNDGAFGFYFLPGILLCIAFWKKARIMSMGMACQCTAGTAFTPP